VTAPRAVGVRLPYADVPQAVRDWVDSELGSPVVSWNDRVGGMSPGCATRLVAADGSRAFVKAVGAELNPDSPTLFRREIAVLELIGADPLWASLRASYDDDDGWVALLLEDVAGGHPDLAGDGQMTDLLDATDALVARLATVDAPEATAREIGQPGLLDARARFRVWQEAVERVDELPDDLVPRVLRGRAGALRDLATDLAEGGSDQLLHCDIRVDNLLSPGPGRIVFVDWGAAAVGPAWVDPLLARLERVDSAWFDESTRLSPALREVGEDRVTGWLVAFGAHLAWQSTRQRADVGLPTLNEFRRTEARRFLGAAARRLGRGPTSARK
jgi:Phosphotransferase enzyme family